MKIRTGFISNSSSSSFIITEDNYNEINCPHCKELISKVFEHGEAQEFISNNYDSVKEYLDDHEDCTYQPPMVKYVKNNDIIYFKQMEMDNTEIIYHILNSIGVDFEVEEH